MTLGSCFLKNDVRTEMINLWKAVKRVSITLVSLKDLDLFVRIRSIHEGFRESL